MKLYIILIFIGFMTDSAENVSQFSQQCGYQYKDEVEMHCPDYDGYGWKYCFKMQSKLECAFDFLYKKCNEETARELYVKRRAINPLKQGAYEWECQSLYEYWKRGSATTVSNSLVLLVTLLVVSKLLS